MAEQTSFFAKRTDGNQQRIVKALRAAGATVQCLHFVGRGFPDLLVGVNGRNILCEVKDGSRPPSRRRLTAAEKSWHERWRGQCCVVTNEQEALQACGLENLLTLGGSND